MRSREKGVKMPAQKNFSKTQFEKLCKIQCTKEEICDWFFTTDTTLESWVKREYNGAGFKEIFEQKKSKGKISLRRSQFRMAQKNVTMAIFLGKQWLGQKDVSRSEITGEGGGPVKTEQPSIDWSEFSIVQLDIIARMMKQVSPDDNSDSGENTKGPIRIASSQG